MNHEKPRLLHALLICVVTVMVTMWGCGSNSSSTPTSTPPPAATTPPAPPPAPADAVITLTGIFECLNRFCDNAAFDLILRNTGGVGANLNFIRVENRNGQPILELGADHFINTFGNNRRLEAGETMEFVLTSQLGFVVIVGYGDDNGNA